MKILFCGDIVGRKGREIILKKIPGLIEKLQLDCVVVNAENAASGFGVTSKICKELFDCGVNVITTGNHTWDNKDVFTVIEHERRLIRPVNYPEGTPGRGATLIQTRTGYSVLVINVLGRVFMTPLDCPFRAVEKQIMDLKLGRDVDAIIVDVHAEATSEKMAMGHFLDGQVSLVVGSHSHIPTADCQILPKGTAYQSDAGMCGDYNSVVGMDIKEPLQRFIYKINSGRYEPANGDATLCGTYVETDSKTGLAKKIMPVRLGARLQETPLEMFL